MRLSHFVLIFFQVFTIKRFRLSQGLITNLFISKPQPVSYDQYLQRRRCLKMKHEHLGNDSSHIKSEHKFWDNMEIEKDMKIAVLNTLISFL